MEVPVHTSTTLNQPNEILSQSTKRFGKCVSTDMNGESVTGVDDTNKCVLLTEKSATVEKLENINSKGKKHLCHGFLQRGNCIVKYKPPKCAFKSQQKPFNCEACGDSFLFQSSYKSHILRRSIKLSFSCSYCPDKDSHREFPNKCALWLHLMDHVLFKRTAANDRKLVNKVNVGMVDLADVTSPILTDDVDEVDSFISQPDTTFVQSLKQISVDSADDISGNVTKINLGSVTINQKGSSSLKNDLVSNCKLPPCGILGISWDCPECFATMASKADLAKHFSAKDVKYTGTCDVCYLMMPNKCSFVAHKRTHQFTPPYICPECGKQILSLSLFKRHLNSKCFHNCRLMWLSCLICPNSGFANTFLLKTHFQMHHRDQFYRCVQCPVAFTHWDGMTKHAIEVHGISANVSSLSEQVYQCHFCRLCYMNNDLFMNHLENHIDASFKCSTPKYKCPICCKLLLLLNDLIEHLDFHNNRRHQVIPYMCDYCGHPCNDYASEITHETQHHVTYVRKFFLNAQKHGQIKLNNSAVGSECVIETGDKTDSHENVATASSNVTRTKELGNENSNSTLENHDVVLNNIKHEVPDSESDCNSSCVGKSCCADRKKTLEELERQLKQEVIDVRVKLMNMPHTCTFCGLAFEMEEDLISHHCPCNQPEDSKDSIEERPKDDEYDKNINSESTSASSDESISGLEAAFMPLHYHVCGACRKSFKSLHDLENHLTDSHGFALGSEFSCLLCGLTYASINDLNAHEKNVHQRHKVHIFYCTICKEQNISKSYKHKIHLISHLNKVHRINRNKELATMVMRQIDDMELQVAKSNPYDEDDESQSEESDVNTAKRSLLSSNESPALKRLRMEGGSDYYCAKCPFSSVNRIEFLDHIKLHKIEEDSYQCSECGVCFSVIPSLKRHLIVVHKVQNISKYVSSLELKRNTNVYDATLYFKLNSVKMAKDKPKIDANDINATSNDSLECQVCYRVFENMSLLKAHMRTHGMAFIQSKRIQS